MSAKNVTKENKMNLEVIWANAVIEIWNERINEGSCNHGEAILGIERARDNYKNRHKSVTESENDG